MILADTIASDDSVRVTKDTGVDTLYAVVNVLVAREGRINSTRRVRERIFP